MTGNSVVRIQKGQRNPVRPDRAITSRSNIAGKLAPSSLAASWKLTVLPASRD
jgi:hypothetical protein